MSDPERASEVAVGRLNTTTIRQVYDPAKFIIDGGLDRVGPKVLDTVAALCDEVDRLRSLTVDDPTSIYHEHEQLRQIIARHDADRELGRCDGLLQPGAGGDGAR